MANQAETKTTSGLVDASTPVGEEVYDENGYAYELVQWTPHGVVARALNITNDGESYPAKNVSIIPQLFNVAVDMKRSIAATEMEMAVESSRHKLEEISRNIKAADKAFADALAKTSAIPALSRIQDFIDGKVTHYVREQYGTIEIIKKADSGKPDYNGRVPDDFKLLTLYGSSKGDLSWKIHEYSDGGFSLTCVPCTSYEEAISEATKIATRLFAESRPNGFANLRVQLVQSCVKLGIPVPADVIEKLEHKHDNDGAFANERIAKIKAEYAKDAQDTANLVAACKAIARAEGSTAQNGGVA